MLLDIIRQPDNGLPLQITSASCAATLRAPTPEYLPSSLVAWRSSIVPERLIVPLLLRVANNKARQTELNKLKIDENPPQAAIAVAKGMDGLKIQVKSGNLIEEVGAEIAGILDEDFIYHALYVFGCRRNMSPPPARIPPARESVRRWHR